MKKLLVMLFLALMPGLNAATNTPTPTYTPTAVAIFSQGTNRLFVYPDQCYQNDGVRLVSAQTTPVPGDETLWLAAALSQTSAVFSTGTAMTRINFTVPCDYENTNGSLKLYAHGLVSVAGLTTTAFCVNTNVARMNRLTSTALTSSYLGVTFNVQTGGFVSADAISLTTQSGQRLLDSRWSRFYIPLSGTVAKTLHPGDTVDLQVVKVTGDAAQVSVQKFELEYNKVMSTQPCSGN